MMVQNLSGAGGGHNHLMSNSNGSARGNHLIPQGRYTPNIVPPVAVPRQHWNGSGSSIDMNGQTWVQPTQPMANNVNFGANHIPADTQGFNKPLPHGMSTSASYPGIHQHQQASHMQPPPII